MRKLADVARSHRPLITLPSDATAQDACREMREKAASSVLVTDERGSLVGIFTTKDAAYRVVAAGKDAGQVPLADVMTRNPVCLSPDRDAMDALRMMWDGGFRHIPLTRYGKVVGLVARNDFKGRERERLDEERDYWEHMR